MQNRISRVWWAYHSRLRDIVAVMEDLSAPLARAYTMGENNQHNCCADRF